MHDTSFAIRFSGVSKRYTIHHEKPACRQAGPRSSSDWPTERMRSSGFTRENAKHLFRALKDVNLTIRKGKRHTLTFPPF